MSKLTRLTRMLREFAYTGSSFMPFGAVGTAHSFRGPEPGKMHFATAWWETPEVDPGRGPERENSGQDREQTRRKRQWLKPKR